VSRNGVGEGGFFGSGNSFPGQIPDFHHGYAAAGLILAAWAGIACLAAFGLFNRRDID